MPPSKKHFEVERKFRLSDREYGDLPKRLKELGFKHSKEAVEHDTFLPVEKKGDMLRIRDEKEQTTVKHVLTRKVWVETGGERERSEHEEELSKFLRDTILEVVARAAQKPLKTLSKKRDFFTSVMDGHDITVTLDYVREIGQHSGPYMEVEFLVEKEEDVPLVRKNVKELARTLLNEDRDDVRMSYQDMLNQFLEQHTGKAG